MEVLGGRLVYIELEYGACRCLKTALREGDLVRSGRKEGKLIQTFTVGFWRFGSNCSPHLLGSRLRQAAPFWSKTWPLNGPVASCERAAEQNAIEIAQQMKARIAI